ncbi:helix-turn-helix transcriptional regulator [Streptomyces rimosus]|uniref:helix-turn-helix domain-containing protein n=1 Tax=Streptomyces rimosus TaxID=1927 RepID=UPI001F2F2DBA|nr:helix-turn-helix transcriptional regulator [Streptomyces rimosus]
MKAAHMQDVGEELVIVMGRIEPSAARTHVGGLIKICRQRVGMTQRILAKETHVSESLEGAYERGERIPSAGFLIDADRLTVADGTLESCVELMEQEPSRAQFLEWQLLEAEALSIGGYLAMVIPGLLQTPDYIRALHRSRVPALRRGDIDELAQERLERQAVLLREPAPTVSFVIEEGALHRPLGGEGVLKAALLHAAATARELAHVTLQVMPTVTPTHAGLTGPLDLLFSPDGRDSVFLEGQDRSRLLTKPVEAAHHRERFGALRAEALSPGKSLELIEKVAGEL